MTDKQRIFKNIFFVVWGVLSICFGLVICIPTQTTYHRCTEKIDAVIVDVAKESTRSSNTFMEHFSYTPVFQYMYDGREYTSHMDTYVSYDENWPGKQCIIHVNPDDPKELYYEDIQKVSVIVYAAFMGVGCIVLIAGIFHIIRRK